MSKWKAYLHRLERKCSDLEKSLASQRDQLIAEVIVVFAVVVWMGAMLLLP